MFWDNAKDIARYHVEGVLVAGGNAAAAAQTGVVAEGPRIKADFGAQALGEFQSIGDFDGDGSLDVVLWPLAANATSIRSEDGGTIADYGDGGGAALVAVADFDGDGDDDLLVQNVNTGAVQVLNGGGGLQMSFGDAPVGGVKAIGDLDGDGNLDIVVLLADGTFQGRDGADGSNVADYANASEWNLVAIGEFDGDGKDELLFRNLSTGRMEVRDGDGNVEAFLGFYADATIEAIADFDGDGGLDLLLERSTGAQIVVGGAAQGKLTNFGNTSTWELLAVGDYDGDGRDDVLFRSVEKDRVVLRDGDGNVFAQLGKYGSDTLEGVGDFNGDGNRDILLQNDTGQIRSIDGTGLRKIANYAVSSRWEFLAVGDFDGNGVDDVEFQNVRSGVTVAFNGNPAPPEPENNAPTLDVPIADQAPDPGSAVAFVIPEGTFSDPDGDTLTYTAQLADGAALPEWLLFDGTAFTGTPPTGLEGEFEIEVTASDGEASVSDTFVLTIDALGSSAGFSFASVNSWFDPDTGTGGYNATFDYVVPADAIVGDELKVWELIVDYTGTGDITSAWLGGFPGNYDVDVSGNSIVFTNEGQKWQPDLTEGTEFTVSFEVDGAGFDENEFAFTMIDRDPLPVLADDGNAIILVDPTNAWSSGLTQDVSVENIGDEDIDGWSVVFDVPDGVDFEITNVWGATATELANGDVRFDALGWNEEIRVGKDADFGFNASFSGGVAFELDTASFVFA